MVYPNLPNMSNVIRAWMQPITFTVITKAIVDHQEVETESSVETTAVRVPLKPQELLVKPEGQRAWRWQHIFALTTLELNPDDVVVFDSIRYRVMAKQDFQEYGYIDYEICEDFSS